MSKYKTVLIGIQARSTSERFPGKVFEIIGDKEMLQHVVDAADKAQFYINRYTHKNGMLVITCLLIPKGDPIKERYIKKSCAILEGSEDDVLSRYKEAADKYDADYVVRITGDCPMIPSFLITKHINTAIMNEYDYVSNVYPGLSVAADGTDCEVFSKRLLNWLNESEDKELREHVTLRVRKDPPEWAKIGHVIGFLNLGDLKLSVDNQEDLERVRAQYARIRYAITQAEERDGKKSVHRF